METIQAHRKFNDSFRNHPRSLRRPTLFVWINSHNQRKVFNQRSYFNRSSLSFFHNSDVFTIEYFEVYCCYIIALLYQSVKSNIVFTKHIYSRFKVALYSAFVCSQASKFIAVPRDFMGLLISLASILHIRPVLCILDSVSSVLS